MRHGRADSVHSSQNLSRGTTTKVTGRLIAAARRLMGISREDFAGVAGIPVERIALMEASGSAWLNSESDAEAVTRAFERFGVVVIEEDASMGPASEIHSPGRETDKSAGKRRWYHALRRRAMTIQMNNLSCGAVIPAEDPMSAHGSAHAARAVREFSGVNSVMINLSTATLRSSRARSYRQRHTG